VKESILSDCAVFILRFALFAAIHSLLATHRSKEFARRMAGREIAAYRLFYNLLSLVMFPWVMAADGCATVLYFAPGVWSLLMYLCQLLIVIALFSCIRQTGAATFLGIAHLRSTGESSPPMTTSGWYSVVRHPLYLLSIIYLTLSPVMTTQRALLTLLSIIYFICGGLLEERRLLEEFGDQYRQYRRQVPFLIPRLRLPRPPSTD
jgi:protein-S-isoprenylcysteine O-methyltransferase Ste14